MFRPLFLYPMTLSFVVTGTIWAWLYDPDAGVFNHGLRTVGLGRWAQPWIADPRLATFCLVGAAIWQYTGFAMTLYLAAIREIPREIFEGARVDGASDLQVFRYVVIPNVGHATMVVTAMLILFTLKVFDLVWVMTFGGPGELHRGPAVLHVRGWTILGSFGGSSPTWAARGRGSALGPPHLRLSPRCERSQVRGAVGSLRAPARTTRCRCACSLTTPLPLGSIAFGRAGPLGPRGGRVSALCRWLMPVRIDPRTARVREEALFRLRTSSARLGKDQLRHVCRRSLLATMQALATSLARSKMSEGIRGPTPAASRLLLVIPSRTSFVIFLAELASELRRRNVDVHVATSATHLGGVELADSDVGADQLCFHPLAIPRGFDLGGALAAARKLKHLVAQLRPAIVHAHFAAAGFAVALATNKTWPPRVVSFQGLNFPLLRGWQRVMWGTLESWIARRATETWVVTKDDEQALRERCSGARISTYASSGFGCQLERFDLANVTPQQRAMWRERWRAAPHTTVFAFIGRQVAFKGYHHVVRAALVLARDGLDLKVILVGTSDRLHSDGLSDAERRSVVESSTFVHLGWRNDLPDILSACDVVVFPSQREGMPVNVMEALAMGVPVISANVRGCRDVVRSGVDGLLLRDVTEASVTDAMRQLACDSVLRARFAAAAVEGRERFDRKTYVEAEISNYRRLGLAMR